MGSKVISVAEMADCAECAETLPVLFFVVVDGVVTAGSFLPEDGVVAALLTLLALFVVLSLDLDGDVGTKEAQHQLAEEAWLFFLRSGNTVDILLIVFRHRSEA